MNTTSTMRRRNGASQGFTLIEVLLVVAILGILATVAVFNIGGIFEESKASATRTTIDQALNAIQAYKLTRGDDPAGWQDMLVETENYPALFDTVPKDAWGQELQMKKVSRFRYEVRSAGDDGQFGTADDIWK